MKTKELNKIRKQVNEDIGMEASNMEKNHEIQMARADCYFAAKSAISVHQLLEKLADTFTLNPMMKERISAAADTFKSIKEELEFSVMNNELEPQIDGIEDFSILALGEDASAGGTSSGGIATVPAGKKKKLIKRK